LQFKGLSIKYIRTKSQKIDPFPPCPQNDRTTSTLQAVFIVKNVTFILFQMILIVYCLTYLHPMQMSIPIWQLILKVIFC